MARSRSASWRRREAQWSLRLDRPSWPTTPPVASAGRTCHARQSLPLPCRQTRRRRQGPTPQSNVPRRSLGRSSSQRRRHPRRLRRKPHRLHPHRLQRPPRPHRLERPMHRRRTPSPRRRRGRASPMRSSKGSPRAVRQSPLMPVPPRRTKSYRRESFGRESPSGRSPRTRYSLRSTKPPTPPSSTTGTA